MSLDVAMRQFRQNPTVENAFNVRSHMHPNNPGQENAPAYLAEVNSWINAELHRQNTEELKPEIP
jgi:hypothetical protein